MSIKIRVSGAEAIKQNMFNAGRRYNALQTRKIDYWTGFFRDKVRTGNFFQNPTPNLQMRVWADRAKRVGDTIQGQAGWGSSYGPILEFGVDPSNQLGWWIAPKKKNGRLRFMGNKGKVVYPKGVWHPWVYDDDGSAPHWSKVIAKYRKRFERDLSDTIVEAMRG